MLRFFKNKNQRNKFLKNGLGFCFLGLILVSIFFVIAIPKTSHAVFEETFTGALDFVIGSLVKLAVLVILGVSSFLVYLSGQILEAILSLSIVHMHSITDADGVIKVWKLFRDVANMFFIFVLLYIAIGTILGLGNINTKKMLVRVVIIAILLNFSMFFTKVLIDASNIVTIGFYNQIGTTLCVSNEAGDIGTAFMCKLGLTSFYDTVQEHLTNITFSDLGGSFKVITGSVVGSLFFLIAAFVFGAAGIMFIARLIILIILIMLSPLAFVAMALPSDKYSSQWWDSLLKQCIFAPVFMALLWATLQILNVFGTSNGQSLFRAVSGQNGKASPGAGSVFLNFTLVIGMIIASLLVASKLGVYGASGAMKILGEARKRTQGVMWRTAVRASGMTRLDEKIGETRWAHTALGDAVRRGTTGFLVSAKAGSKYSALDAKKESQEFREKRTEISHEVEANRKIKEAQAGYAAVKKTREDARAQDGTTETGIAERARLEKLATGMEEKINDDIQKVVLQLSPKAFTQISKANFFNPEFMRHASRAQYLALMSSDRLKEDEKVKATEAKYQYIEETLEEFDKAKTQYLLDFEKWKEGVNNGTITGDDIEKLQPKEPKLSIGEEIKNVNVKELEYLNQHHRKLLDNKEFVSRIKSDTVSDFRKSDMATTFEKQELRKLKYAPVDEAASKVEAEEKNFEEHEAAVAAHGMALTAAERKAHEDNIMWAKRALDAAVSGKSAKEIAGAPSSVWKKPAILDRMDRSMLSQFSDKDIGDKEAQVKHMLKRYEQHKKFVAGDPDGREMTYANKSSMNWLLNDKRNGVNFLPSTALERIRAERAAAGLPEEIE